MYLTKSDIACAIIAVLLLSACGGGGLGYTPTTEIEPQAGYLRWSGAYHASIGVDGRQDYKDAMYDDCVKENGYLSCSRLGYGWFVPWRRVPVVVISRSSKQEEVWAIRRAIAIVNRTLPVSTRLKADWTNQSLVGFNSTIDYERTEDWVSDGTIHVEIYPYDDPNSSGIAWTDGERAFALVDQVDHDLASDEDGFHWSIRSAIETMVHEFLHALGLVAHPHSIHTANLSYRHHREGEPDNVPLIEAAVFYDMYNLGQWAENIDFVVDTVDGVQFGVYGLYNEDEEDFSTAIPWVDAGYMAAPKPDALLGSASYQGELAGIITSSGYYAAGDADLSVNFDTGSGSAWFDQIQAYDGTTWSMWNRRGYRYTLNLYAHYFDSSTDPRDRDGIPDVVGAFYGWDAEVAAGTLQRPEITAAFGGELQ